MKSVLWLLLGMAIGGVAGWYLHALGGGEVRATARFAFSDRLAQAASSGEPHLLAKGTWRGSDLANKINTVEIMCETLKMTCEMIQADVMSWGGPPGLSLYTESFRITKLDAQSVLAEAVSPGLCIRQTLTFDRLAKAVTFARTKIIHEDSCSLVQKEPVTLFLGEPL
jgi:hypothetical protein